MLVRLGLMREHLVMLAGTANVTHQIGIILGNRFMRSRIFLSTRWLGVHGWVIRSSPVAPVLRSFGNTDDPGTFWDLFEDCNIFKC